jgi:foldase protein PrsA
LNDKVKGIILGALLGSAITGSAAYASGAQIEVLFRPLTYLFDGVEKKPAEGTGFIYEGSTYVPIRFVSEALGKEVGWDDATGTISIDEPGAAAVVAAYKDGERELTVAQRAVNKRASIIRLLNPSYDQYAEDPGFLSQMKTELAADLIIEGRADAGTLESAAAEAAAELDKLKKDFDLAFAGQLEWASRLSQLKLAESDVQNYIRLSAVRIAYLDKQVTDAKLEAAYKDASAAHEFDKATVSHILVGLTDESGAARTKEDALARAKEALAKLKAGEDFAKTVLAYSDDPGSKNTGGKYENAAVSSWVEGFRKAVLEQPLDEVGEPVETEYGYHIIRVESRDVPALAEVSGTLKNRLMNSAYKNLIQVDLPGLEQTLE